MSAAPQLSPAVAAGPALEVSDLARGFGPVRALRGVSFALERGEALAVFGPNGAGKSTLLRLLAGLLRPERGSIRLFGHPFNRSDAAQRVRIGLISHASLLYDGLTGRENLEFTARCYRLSSPREAAQRALESMGLVDAADRAAGTYSRGMTQRLAIARALLHDPEIVLLDEPFTGLDTRAAGVLRSLLERLRADRRTLVLVTHNLEEGLELATQVALQVSGRFVMLDRRGDDPSLWRARYAEAVAGA
ncbi:MAG TPA: ABC transporter ATP-binding protein [Gemmatimonadales bacterium]|nr:ABC transporter ATP-binding protein [Gemmatimonadales bacterium]